MGDNAEEILGTYKRMMAECQQIASKVQEVGSAAWFAAALSGAVEK